MANKNMALTVEMIEKEALNLPLSERAVLLERLLASLAGKANSAVERVHLEEIRVRRAAVASRTAKLIDSVESRRRVRDALRT
jgi:hypothetical protein